MSLGSGATNHLAQQFVSKPEKTEHTTSTAHASLNTTESNPEIRMESSHCVDCCMHTKAPFRVRHNKPCSCLSVWQSAVSVIHLVCSLSLCLFPACNNICSEADRCEQGTKHCHLITKPHSVSVRNTRDCSVCSPVTHPLQ